MARRLSTVVVAVTSVTALLVGAAPAAPAETGPETGSFLVAAAYSIGHPAASPPGANDWSCRPSARHPRPVVLVHGTWENRYDNFARLSPTLKRDGYCVFALNYGDSDADLSSVPEFIKGSGDIRRSEVAVDWSTSRTSGYARYLIDDYDPFDPTRDRREHAAEIRRNHPHDVDREQHP